MCCKCVIYVSQGKFAMPVFSSSEIHLPEWRFVGEVIDDKNTEGTSSS